MVSTYSGQKYVPTKAQVTRINGFYFEIHTFLLVSFTSLRKGEGEGETFS